MKKKLFGTDGIRGLVNKEPFTKEYLIILADAIFTIVKKTKNKSIFMVKPKIEKYEKLSKMLTNLINLAKEGKIDECYKLMSEIEPQYKKTKIENLQIKRVVQ